MLKKLALALMTFVISFSCNCVAEGNRCDIKDMTTEELFELQTEITIELSGREETDFAQIYPGTYVVGNDISEGAYILCFSTDDSSNSPALSYYIYENEEQYVADPTKWFEGGLERANSVCRLSLKNGMVVNFNVIEDGVCFIKKAEPII